jgi:hypothetical protein
MPKILTPEELSAIKKRQLGKKHPVRIAIEQLEPQQAVQISRKEFTWRQRTPRVFCNELSKKTNKRFTISALLDNSGWIVQRVDEGTD